jgi:hypothetical protein
MSRARIQHVAEAVRRRAQRQGFVVPRQVREEMANAGLNGTDWKRIIGLVGPALACRHGRYYYVPAGPSRMKVRVRRDQNQQRRIDRTVRGLIREQRAAEGVMIERRAQRRHPFNQPVEVRTANHRCLHMVSREISVSGIRLIGSRALQGQKAYIWIPRPDQPEERCCFLVHILWSAGVGDDLFENGGVLLELVEAEPMLLKLAGSE